MLKNIKASYFIQKIFTFIDEAQKLKLIRHNKNLQMNLNISLINYKFFNFVYVIHEPNGIAKEYLGFEDMLMFEGEYLNGKRNGKGKEYDWNGKLIFEGEYLNGKRNGNGKEYDNKGNLIFEGEYLNGKRNGKGKEYNEKGKLIFEGDYFNDLLLIGNVYDNDGILHKVNNNLNGYGKEYNSYGKLLFEGEYLNGKRNGKGKEYNWDDRLIFEGEYLNGKKHGIGKEYDDDGNLIFEGEYKYDKKWKGKFYVPSNNKIWKRKRIRLER